MGPPQYTYLNAHMFLGACHCVFNNNNNNNIIRNLYSVIMPLGGYREPFQVRKFRTMQKKLGHIKRLMSGRTNAHEYNRQTSIECDIRQMSWRRGAAMCAACSVLF